MIFIPEPCPSIAPSVHLHDVLKFLDEALQEHRFKILPKTGPFLNMFGIFVGCVCILDSKNHVFAGLARTAKKTVGRSGDRFHLLQTPYTSVNPWQEASSACPKLIYGALAWAPDSEPLQEKWKFPESETRIWTQNSRPLGICKRTTTKRHPQLIETAV